ncbi:MAG TPA: DsbA family protein [Chitinophagaceae bacterium]|nr:DsbA family protein [Chitinophagaceae bacterium]
MLIPHVSKNDHVQGNSTAQIELVEYGDYQCPHCGKAYTIVKYIQSELGDSLKFVFRNFPLKKVHPLAMTAAIASEAAGLQGRFWEMHDLLFENQIKLTPNNILIFAERMGLEMADFKNDLTSHELESKVLSDFESGLRSGVNATPTFFINGDKYEGDWTSKEFIAFLLNVA